MSTNQTPNPETFHGKFIAEKRNRLKDFTIDRIQGIVKSAGGWEAEDAASMRKFFSELTQPLSELESDPNNEDIFHRCNQALNNLHTALVDLSTKYPPSVDTST